jgi:hypothetical protein
MSSLQCTIVQWACFLRLVLRLRYVYCSNCLCLGCILLLNIVLFFCLLHCYESYQYLCEDKKIALDSESKGRFERDICIQLVDMVLVFPAEVITVAMIMLKVTLQVRYTYS